MIDISQFALRLDKVYANGRRPNENLELINKFVRKNKHSGLRKASIALYYQALQIFSEWCEKPIGKLTDDDILDFLDYLDEYTFVKCGKTKQYSPTSKKTFKVLLKKFFNDSGFTQLGEVLKEKGSRKLEQKDRKDLLTKQEIESLINSSQIPRDKAMVSSLYESGCRRGELLNCLIEDLTFDENGVLMTFPDGKTGKRTVRLVYSASYLRQWIEVHPCRLPNGEPDPKAPLLTSMWSKDGVYNRLSEHGLAVQIKKIAKRAGITKRVNPHSFRHARASDLAEHLTEQQLKQYLGWTQSSNMAAVYVHNPETENAILKMNGIMIDETHTDGLKVGKCPRCKELNPEKAKYCLKCGLPLTQETATDIDNSKSEINKEFFLAAIQDPAIQELLKGLSK